MSAPTDHTLHLAVAQMGPVHLADTRERVVSRLVEMLREAKARGADLVVYPELALTTFFPRYWMSIEEAVERFFETEMPGPAVQPLFDEARRLGVAFCLGYAELTPEGQRFNTAILVGRDGSIIGKYRKTHIPGHSEHKPEAPFQHLEMRYFEPGDLGFRVFETGMGTIGMLVCNDRRWPESYRVLALQGCEIVLVGYNTPTTNIHWNEPAHLRMFHNHLTLQASAYHNSQWIGSAAKCGAEDGFQMIGGSVIVSPAGEIVNRTTSEEDEVIVSRVDRTLGDGYRRNVFNFAKHRRPDQYRLIVERTAAGPPVD
jgi:predicted amidohydrolase